MRLKQSPYFCIKGELLETEVIQGDRRDPNNPYRWFKIILNLPGSKGYDPREPRVWKAQSADRKQIAAVLCQYVDDLRNAAASERNCWKVMHKTATLLCYLGIQVAARKIMLPSQIPGA